MKRVRRSDPLGSASISHQSELASMMVNTTLLSRAALAAGLGKSFAGDRDIYIALGLPKSITFDMYWDRYKRQGIAKRVVNAPAASTWRGVPQVFDRSGDGKNPTVFDDAWKDLIENGSLWHYFLRVDMLAGIGEYAVLLLGFDDNTDPSQPVNKSRVKKLRFVRPLSEDSAKIETYIEDPTNPKYGMPEYYTMGIPDRGPRLSQRPRRIHHSRVIHIADGLLEDDVFGTPRLECVFNELMLLELVSCGSGEMFWRGAFPGFGFKLDPEADVRSQDTDAIKTQIENYVHGLSRYLKLQGIDIQELRPQVADPSKHKDMLLDLISGATGIPQRILTGSEQGELASSQDESNWNSRIMERRETYAETVIVRPFIDRLVSFGILPPVPDGVAVEWPDIFSLSAKDRAEIGEIKARALANYANAPGADLIVPHRGFLIDLLDVDPRRVDEWEEQIQGQLEGEQALLEEFGPELLDKATADTRAGNSPEETPQDGALEGGRQPK